MSSKSVNQKLNKPEHQRKYRDKLKKVMKILDDTLKKCGSDIYKDPQRNSQMILKEAQKSIEQMEGELSQLLAFERMERTDNIQNSALLTLSNCKAAFSQALHRAEELSKHIDDPKEAEEYIMNYMKKDPVQFFSGIGTGITASQGFGNYQGVFTIIYKRFSGNTCFS
ncbi:unnamed protein product [Meganyctiphanes norvegica]|uniref:Uncharacterized protein n=1 Tax=Meganyctiphanes norvegica TaxID=48144 RepID=A0AAV2RSG0_MEGNR